MSELNKEKIEKLLSRYVEPHDKISREVKDSDIKKVVEECSVMHDLCYIQRGLSNGAYAIAHPQIDDKDPMRFFVLRDSGKIIINPKIIRHTKHTVDSLEGCLSYPYKERINVQRWNKVEVEYFTLSPGDKDDEIIMIDMKESLNGRDAKIYQHEIDHLDGKYIY